MTSPRLERLGPSAGQAHRALSIYNPKIVEDSGGFVLATEVIERRLHDAVLDLLVDTIHLIEALSHDVGQIEIDLADVVRSAVRIADRERRKGIR